jgi:hypothetical protein
LTIEASFRQEYFASTIVRKGNKTVQLKYIESFVKKIIKNNFKKSIKIQKKAIRIITFNSYIAKSAPLFQQLKLLNLNQINDLCVSLFMFDYINGNLPASFNDYFTTNTKIHHHDTESQILFTKNISEQITGNSQLKRKEQIYGIKFHHK